jgi:hypothetical protein
MVRWQFWRADSASAGRSPEAVFWQWFTANEAQLFDFEGRQEKIFRSLSIELRKVHSSLVFEFSVKRDGKRDFVISADGIRDAIPVVARLVKAAPPLPRWHFIAFRPRKQLSKIVWEGAELSPEETYCLANQRDSAIDVTLYLPDRVFGNGQAHLALGFLMLDCTLGEYDVATKLGTIEMQEVSKAGAAQLLPLSELADLVDRVGPNRVTH